jgi:hypothetical protein
MKDSHDKRREAEVYEAKKHLAEMAWVALLMNSDLHIAKGHTVASVAWLDAEEMYAESERRRPQE